MAEHEVDPFRRVFDDQSLKGYTHLGPSANLERRLPRVVRDLERSANTPLQHMVLADARTELGVAHLRRGHGVDAVAELNRAQEGWRNPLFSEDPVLGPYSLPREAATATLLHLAARSLTGETGYESVDAAIGRQHRVSISRIGAMLDQLGRELPMRERGEVVGTLGESVVSALLTSSLCVTDRPAVARTVLVPASVRADRGRSREEVTTYKAAHQLTMHDMQLFEVGGDGEVKTVFPIDVTARLEQSKSRHHPAVTIVAREQIAEESAILGVLVAAGEALTEGAEVGSNNMLTEMRQRVVDSVERTRAKTTQNIRVLPFDSVEVGRASSGIARTLQKTTVRVRGPIIN